MHPESNLPQPSDDAVPSRATAPPNSNESADSAGSDAHRDQRQRDDSDHPVGDLLLDQGPEKIRRWLAPGGGDMTSAGLQFAGALLLFTLGGNWLDGKFGTKPWLLLTGIALGLVGGFISLLKQAQAAGRG